MGQKSELVIGGGGGGFCENDSTQNLIKKL